jgi:hypothetical protein
MALLFALPGEPYHLDYSQLLLKKVARQVIVCTMEL